MDNNGSFRMLTKEDISSIYLTDEPAILRVPVIEIRPRKKVTEPKVYFKYKYTSTGDRSTERIVWFTKNPACSSATRIAGLTPRF